MGGCKEEAAISVAMVNRGSVGGVLAEMMITVVGVTIIENTLHGTI